MTVQHHLHDPDESRRDERCAVADSPNHHGDPHHRDRDPRRVAASRDVDALPGAIESKYGRAVEDENVPSTRFAVDDGEINATLNNTELSDAAADALWHLIENATRKGTTG